MWRRLKKPQWAWFVPAAYWPLTSLLRAILFVVARWRVRGRGNVPRTGGVIVVSNHLSNADPPIVGAGVQRRRIVWMAKAELFEYPFGVVPRLWGATPVRRFEADMGAMLRAERLLKQGGVLGMFPEGTRSRSQQLGRPHPGTALIALRSGATVLPCAVAGTERLTDLGYLLRRPRVSVTIGKPIVLEPVRRPTEEQVSELTERIFAEIKALLPPKYHGSYTEDDGGDPPRG